MFEKIKVPEGHNLYNLGNHNHLTLALVADSTRKIKDAWLVHVDCNYSPAILFSLKCN